MCEYCESSHELDVDSYAGLRMEIVNRYNVPQLMTYATIDAGFFGYQDIDGTLDIHYCPICGRNLIEEEENDEEE